MFLGDILLATITLDQLWGLCVTFGTPRILLISGDRVDVVINTNQADNLYWIQAKTTCDSITAEAVLQYEGDNLQFASKRPNSGSFQRGRASCFCTLNLT